MKDKGVVSINDLLSAPRNKLYKQRVSILNWFKNSYMFPTSRPYLPVFRRLDFWMLTTYFFSLFSPAWICEQRSWNWNLSVVCRLSVRRPPVPSIICELRFLSNFSCCFPWVILPVFTLTKKKKKKKKVSISFRSRQYGIPRAVSWGQHSFSYISVIYQIQWNLLLN